MHESLQRMRAGAQIIRYEAGREIFDVRIGGRFVDPKVSVLLPVYNGGAALWAAVCSLLHQTMAEWELLLLDDGSTDGCIEPIARLGDPRIRVLGSKERRGLAWRLNEGIDAAHGRYIARMDHDDLAFPDRLRMQVEFLDAHPEVHLLGTRAIAFNEDGTLLGSLPFRGSHAEICAQPWRGFSLPHPTWMARADWFRLHRYRSPEALRAEDQELLLRSYPTSCFASLPQPLLAYRVRAVPLRSVLQARLSLVAAMLREHSRAGRYREALLACLSSMVKAGADLIFAALGSASPTGRAVVNRVPADVASRWRDLWTSTEACAARMRASGLHVARPAKVNH